MGNILYELALRVKYQSSGREIDNQNESLSSFRQTARLKRDDLTARLVRVPMKHRSYALRVGLALAVAYGLPLGAAQSWNNKDYRQWTQKEVEQLLNSSPWAQQASAFFGSSAKDEASPPVTLPGPAQAGMADRRGATDGSWDGGVSRNVRGGVPSLPVMVRWDSALPVREALLRSQSGDSSPAPVADDPTQAQKDYIITLAGLVPGGAYHTSGENPQDPGEMLKGLMGNSVLVPRGKPPISPEKVKLDAATGTVHLFFPRTESIQSEDKEVTFAARFGSIRVQKSFRLKDMIYRGKLEL